MDQEKGGQHQYQPRKRTNDSILLGLMLVLQLVSLGLAVVFYDAWYSVSVVGASAIVSSLLCGFSQGLLQIIMHRKFHAGSLLKYYSWGIINGLWTVSILG